ncbi:MAG: M16 family metallopeptidase [Candidatus Ranarchaeia archaeon]
MLHAFSLENGIQCICESKPWAKSVALSLGLGMGARHGQKPGLVYLAMQMLLHGTRLHTATEIFEQIEGVGGTISVTVNRDLTLIRCHIPAPYVNIGVKTLHELVASPLLKESAFEAVKNKMVAQILARENNGFLKTVTVAYESSYPHTAFGAPILGDLKNMPSINFHEAKEALERALDPSNLVISSVGAFSLDKYQALIRKTFGDISASNTAWRPRPWNRKDLSVKEKSFPGYIVASDKKAQAHIGVSFRVVPISDPDFPVLLLTNHLLTGSTSSRLYHEIREKRGLAYTVYGMARGYADTGFWILYAGIHPQGVTEALHIFADQINDLRDKLVPASEFNYAKAHLEGQLRLAFELPSPTADWLAIQQIRRKRPFYFQDLMEQLLEVKPSDIKNVSRNMLRHRNCNIVLVGAVSPDFKPPNSFLFEKNKGQK